VFAGGSTNSLTQIDPQPSEKQPGPRVVTPLGFRPNSLFVGFQLELDQLYTKLQNKKRRELGTCSVLVWGDVGSGKTHLVRQYFYKHRSEYPEGIFWVDCKSTESILNGFWDIGNSVGLDKETTRGGTPPASDDFVDTVRRKLEAIEGWLLVFDGVAFESNEDLDKFIRYLPDRIGNNIVFTSVDRTLAKRQRLLNPTSVRVGALSIPEACDLLFRTLSIRKPSTVQQAKAVELVKDYQCLPLAIHAASHALIEKGKALERYSRGISDTRLINPFLEIMSALREKKHFEASNLIVLLSFFNHYVPVALVHYGYKGLRAFNLDILSPKHAESTRKDLDSTISILMRSGLLERTLQAYPRSSSGHSSPQESRLKQSTNGELPPRALVQVSNETPRSQVTEESSGLELVLARLQTDTDQSSMSSHTSTIDVLRMHTVVQTAIRDDLKDRSSKGIAEFWWWLSAAVRLLTHSFEIASGRMRKSSGHGLVRDYREYKIQAERLWSFFPGSPTNASPALRGSRHELHDLLRAVRREIQNQSPSQSSDSSEQRFQGSIFERSSSTSEGEPQTPTGDLVRAPTWSVDPERPPSESPTAIYSRPNGEKILEWSDSFGSAIDSDNESWPAHSDTTEVPNRVLDRSRRSSALRAIFEGVPKKHKDLGEWKPMAAPPSLSQPNIQIIHSRSSSTASSEKRPARPTTASSEAEVALAAVHRSSPPTSQNGRLRSVSGGSATMGDRPPLATRSPNRQLSPLVSEFSPSNKWDPSSSGSTSKIHSRHASSSPRLVQALLTRTHAARGDLPPLQVDSISLAYPRAGTVLPTATMALPQYSASAQLTNNHLPTGYTSVPMSRNVSKESEPGAAAMANQQHYYVGSAPLRTLSDPELHERGNQMYSLNNPAHLILSPGPASAAERTQDRQERQRQNLAFGRVDEWVNISPSPTTPVFPSFGYALEEQEMEDEAGALRFGGMDPVKIEEARSRAAIGRERSAERDKLKGMEREVSRGRGRFGLGLGVKEVKGKEKGKGKEKENIPLR
jgi:NB-ARC domain